MGSAPAAWARGEGSLGGQRNPAAHPAPAGLPSDPLPCSQPGWGAQGAWAGTGDVGTQTSAAALSLPAAGKQPPADSEPCACCRGVMLCCAVPCCAMACCAVPCHAVLCCAVPQVHVGPVLGSAGLQMLSVDESSSKAPQRFKQNWVKHARN